MRVPMMLAVLSLSIAACGATDEPVTQPATTQAEAVQPTAAATDVPPTEQPTEVTLSGEVAGVEIATCADLIEGGGELGIAIYAGMLEGMIAGDPVNGEVIELTDDERDILRGALDEITEGDTYCGLLPIGE